MDVATFQAAFSAKNQDTVDLNRLVAVQEMIQAVRTNGDQAVIDYTNQFDGQAYAEAADFKVSAERLKASWDNLTEVSLSLCGPRLCVAAGCSLPDVSPALLQREQVIRKYSIFRTTGYGGFENRCNGP